MTLRDVPLGLNPSLFASFGAKPNLSDLEIVRLILRGDSVVDWNRASFRSLADVDRFLSLHLIDMADPDDARRLKYIHSAAITYLEEHLQLQFPHSLKTPLDVRELFVLASQKGGFDRHQILSCVILKLMHVIYHMEAAELRYQVPLSEAVLLDMAARRIEAQAERLRDSEFPLVAFYGSRKARNNIITKLLAKKVNIAATVFDKLRFRVVTQHQKDILPALVWLTRHLVPFNYVIPGQSYNNMLSFEQMCKLSVVPDLYGKLQSNGLDEQKNLIGEDNLFSGANYKMINIIVDFPIRVDHMVELRHRSLLGRVVFVMVEFQIVDEQTAIENEEGDSAHGLYKSRQLNQVKARVRKGGRRWRESQKRDPE